MEDDVGTFWLHSPRKKSSRKLRRAHYHFKIFLSNFLLLTEKIYATDREEMHAVKICHCFSDNASIQPHYCVPLTITNKSVHGNNQEDIPPQSVRSKAKLGHLLTHPHFKSEQKQRNDCLLWAQGWELSKQSENKCRVIWSTCLFYRWEKSNFKNGSWPARMKTDNWAWVCFFYPTTVW